MVVRSVAVVEHSGRRRIMGMGVWLLITEPVDPDREVIRMRMRWSSSVDAVVKGEKAVKGLVCAALN